MEFQKITNFLDTNSDNKDLPRFVTEKWIEVYDQSEGNYNANKEIRIKASMLRPDLCDFNDAYIVVKGMITATNPNNGVKTDNAEDLDVVMPMCNLLEYCKNYRKTTGSLWNYYRDEPSDPFSSDSESFEYKTSITRNTYNVAAGEAGYDANKVGKNETEIVIPLKH